MTAFGFDPEKFRQLVVYIAHRAAADETFGDIKLNKALAWSDFLAYSHLGAPITGARYQHGEWGPTAAPLVPARRQLITEGYVHLEPQPRGARTANVTVADREPLTELFSNEELELVDQVVDRLKGMTGQQVSEHSHKHFPGWVMTEDGEDIPYHTAFIKTTPPSQATLQRARDFAASRRRR